MKIGPETLRQQRPALTTTQGICDMARKPLSVLLGGVTQFGDLTVLGEEDGKHIPGNGAPRLLKCRCSCGHEKLYPLANVTRGKSKSCGCRRGLRVSAAKVTHGHGKKGKVTSEYRTWTHIIDRCCNPNCADYPNYGGRGIKMDARWRNSYEQFFADMGLKPSRRHSIERINVNGNYDAGNCRWATKPEQDRNKRTNRWLEFRGERLCLNDMAAKYGLSRVTLESRLKRGWALDRALLEPLQGR